jgi:twitching motility two-component system response regulator PilH
MRFTAIVVFIAITLTGCGSNIFGDGVAADTPMGQSGSTALSAPLGSDNKNIKGTLNGIKRVLIVVDSVSERQFLTELLTKRGFLVSTAADSAQTMNVLKEVSADALPDVILMDVLTGQNGFKLTGALTRDERYAHIPIIMLIAKNQDADKVWGMRQGARDFVVTPVEPDDLVQKISAFVE